MSIIIVALGLIVLLGVGFFVPLASYTPTQGVCPSGTPPIVRLQLIKGESIEGVKADDVAPAPNVGCARQVKFVLYLL